MKVFVGKVIAVNMAKTATVMVERNVMHPLYKKRYKKARSYHIHTAGEVKVGDVVKFAACAPHSKSKKWEIIES